MKLIYLLGPAVVILLLSGCSSSGVEITNVWIREVPPAIGTTALYMDIKNNSEEKDVLLSVGSAIAETVEIHRSYVNKDGISYMEKMESVRIPASGSVSLEPGGIHVMLIGLTKELKDGESVDVILEFQNAGGRKVSASVRGLN